MGEMPENLEATFRASVEWVLVLCYFALSFQVKFA